MFKSKKVVIKSIDEYKFDTEQVFLREMKKLSNKGWSTNKRLVFLDDKTLGYYKNVPKNFNEQLHFKAFMDGFKPKQIVKINCITEVGSLDEQDMSSKKQKLNDQKTQDRYFKISFLKEGLIDDMCDND